MCLQIVLYIMPKRVYFFWRFGLGRNAMKQRENELPEGDSADVTVGP